ncbi:MAG: hypothetical protein J6W51_05155 [Fibrobacter sp.]|nr:hypothetical protein [Fibrobacter sp.]
MIVILFFSLLILTGCIFEAPCAFCNVEFLGTIDNMDSTKNLQMKLQAPNAGETIFEFEKISDLSSAKESSNYIHQEKNHFIANFFIRTSCSYSYEPCIIEWLIDGKTVKKIQLQERTNKGIIFDKVYLEMTSLDDNKKYDLGTGSRWRIDFDHLPNNP